MPAVSSTGRPIPSGRSTPHVLCDALRRRTGTSGRDRVIPPLSRPRRCRWPGAAKANFGRQHVQEALYAAGGDRVAIYDLEREDGTAVYVHSKACIVDDIWLAVGSDNLNRRSWTHDSEISCAILDETHDEREPRDPAGLGDGARKLARDTRTPPRPRTHRRRRRHRRHDRPTLMVRNAALLRRCRRRLASKRRTRCASPGHLRFSNIMERVDVAEHGCSLGPHHLLDPDGCPTLRRNVTPSNRGPSVMASMS